MNSGGGFAETVSTFADGLKSTCNSSLDTSCMIETYVLPSAECDSACLALFMIGDIRNASQSALFGFHNAAYDMRVIKIPAARKHINQYYHKYGFSEEWLEKNKALFQSLKVTYWTSEQLKESGISLGIAEKDDRDYENLLHVLNFLLKSNH